MRKMPSKPNTLKDILWLTDRGVEIIAENSNFHDRFNLVNLADVILPELNKIKAIVIHANVGNNKRGDRAGLKWIQNLRLNLQSKIPVLVYSFEELAALSKDFSILKTAGIKFLNSPFSGNELDFAIEETLSNSISDFELNEITRWHCGLQEQWQSISHQISGYLGDYQNQHEKVISMVDEWAESIYRFADDQKYNLENFRNLIQLPAPSIDTVSLRKSLEKLDDGLQNPVSNEDDILLTNQDNHLHERPPRGFSKILIADDEPQDFLANSLRNEYRYNVIEPQALKLDQAKSLLDKEKPNVVLSDYYFKRSDRKTEIPDKSIGDEFIFYALKHPSKPLVLVTSKTTLNSVTDIRAGAFNCSGAMRATDPSYIHKMIWQEARKKGVNEPEIIEEDKWTLQHTCRQRLDRYHLNVQNYVNQWSEFGNIVRYTLRQARLLHAAKNSDDILIVEQIIKIFEPFESEKDYSIETVENIFEEVEKIHALAKTAPDSAVKVAVRNILHGYIEQFSSISNEIKFAQKRLLIIADELCSIPQQRPQGEKLKNKLSEFSYSKQIASYLKSLKATLAKILLNLPPLPTSKTFSQKQRKISDNHKINIVIVEDNDYWQKYVLGAIEKAKSKLGDEFIISCQHFGNAADALAAIPAVNKSYAIDNTNEGAEKTIAIVDICLPENSEHAKKIQASYRGETNETAIPHSTFGLDLIRNLSSYNYNIPLIVFSTIDSLEDRLAIGGWGVPQENFIAKGQDDENVIEQALIRLIEKKDKHIIRTFDDEDSRRKFWINGFEIPFPPELRETFSAIYDLSQTTGNRFSIEAVIKARGDHLTPESKKKIYDHINRIRKLIHEAFRKHHRYVNIRNLIRTHKNQFNDEFLYELNAAVASADDEEDYKETVQDFETADCRVLVIENNKQTLGQIIEPLESLGYEVKFATNVEDAVALAEKFEPDVVSLDLQIPYTKSAAGESESVGDEFAGLAAWDKIRSILPDVGVVVPTVNSDKNYLVAKASQMGISIRNFISKKDADWINLFLSKIAQQKREVFLGEFTDSAHDFNQPIVEILDGSDLTKGILHLTVNNRQVKIKKGSSIAKVIGVLLAKPGTVVDFDSIKQKIGGVGAVTIDERKGWTRKIRNHIKDDWLTPEQKIDAENLVKKILEHSDGLSLNVQVFDLRSLKIIREESDE